MDGETKTMHIGETISTGMTQKMTEERSYLAVCGCAEFAVHSFQGVMVLYGCM